MKTILISLFIVAQAFAGAPHQDLIVDLMRERFKASSPNLIEHDIHLEKNWSCVYYNARPGMVPNYSKYRNLFNFYRKDDYSYGNRGELSFKSFKFYEDGYFIGKSSGGSYLVARKPKEDTLIFEYIGTQYKVGRSYVSVSSSKLAGHAYIYCKVVK